MFTKILIANRGEIACRVAATAKRMGIQTVAVYSSADAQARHVFACDEAVLIGGDAPADSYLKWDRILTAAQATGAQAVHPGYGFLSENEAFAKACAAVGIVFIGPPPAAIAAMGSKSAAKTLMAKAGVPLVPGYHGADNDVALLKSEADRMGYPVLIKASAGGGGKGMRRVDHAADFEAALASCQREAQASFGDAHVLVERYVTRPRHIEIQVFADAHGQCIHLGERDCSVQRRHQKVLEESPAPGLSPARRAEMGAAAIAAAQAVGYVGAGTVEFIAEPIEGSATNDLRFYFMEMNTRLQVEHPVTEAVTGFDLVEWQLRVASGDALPITQAQLTMQGHAIEARICAENPEAQFLPATGRMDVARWPQHVSFVRNASAQAGFEPAPVRIDRGFDEGDTVSPHYDSMIAKLIVWGADRAQALSRMDAALAQTHIVGLHTNVAFLRRVVNSQSFARADLDTALIERERSVLFGVQALSIETVGAAVAAHVLAQEQTHEGADPWSKRDGWRLHGAARRHLHLDVHGTAHGVTVQRHHDGALHLVMGDNWHLFDAKTKADGVHRITLGDARFEATVHAHGERMAVFTPMGSMVVHVVDPIAHAGDTTPDAGSLKAPMPGKVVALLVKVGDSVKQGQSLAVIEAMKMEHAITSPKDGVVSDVLYSVGDPVNEGGELLRLAV